MNVEKSKYIGFCSGVKFAVGKALEVLEEEKKLYSYGEIIHNKDVINYLQEKGLIVVDAVPAKTDAKLLIRSHGVSKAVMEEIRANKIAIVDTTCVKVKKIHKIVEEFSNIGYNIIVAGDSEHPEVLGILGWCLGNAVVVENFCDLQNIIVDPNLNYCFVCQTTFNTNVFKKMVEFITKSNYTNIVINNTICDATKKRQDACSELASKCDVMLIVGGKNSSNTMKLYELSKTICDNTFYIENYREVPYKYIDKNTNVGISAGASTPDWIIEEVIQNVRK